jgi:hypothetical protein
MISHHLWLALASFAIAFGACRADRGPPSVTDAAADSRAIDAAVARDGSRADATADVTADTAVEAGIDGANPPPDRLPQDGGGQSDLGADLPREAGRDGASLDGGATCGTAPREMLCLSYCDGIGRFCTGGQTQYRDADECRAACNAPVWACGQPGDTRGDSLFCRLAHMALAGVGAAGACASAGPSSPACQ